MRQLTSIKLKAFIAGKQVKMLGNPQTIFYM